MWWWWMLFGSLTQSFSTSLFRSLIHALHARVYRMRASLCDLNNLKTFWKSLHWMANTHTHYIYFDTLSTLVYIPLKMPYTIQNTRQTIKLRLRSLLYTYIYWVLGWVSIHSVLWNNTYTDTELLCVAGTAQFLLSFRWVPGIRYRPFTVAYHSLSHSLPLSIYFDVNTHSVSFDARSAAIT